MQAIKFIILISSVFFVLLSCEKEIKFKGKEKAPLLVVNGIVENDSVFRIYLERSVFFLEDNISAANNKIESGATLKVTNKNTGAVYVVTVPVSENMYEFPFITEPETDYEIEVEHPGYPTCTSKTRTGKRIELLSVDTSSFIDPDMSTMTRAVLTWNDPAEENYYIIRVKTDFSNVEGMEDVPPYYDWMSSSDVSVESISSNLDGSENSSDFLAVSDKTFNGQQKKLTIELNSHNSDGVVITYQLISTTKETYLYYLSVRKQGNSNPFSEPVKAFSNISNGYGIFGTINYSEIVF